jgi:hypothetical protein
LITVLGDYVRPPRRPAPTSAFIDVLGRLGVEALILRTALSATDVSSTPAGHVGGSGGAAACKPDGGAEKAGGEAEVDRTFRANLESDVHPYQRRISAHSYILDTD